MVNGQILVLVFIGSWGLPRRYKLPIELIAARYGAAGLRPGFGGAEPRRYKLPIELIAARYVAAGLRPAGFGLHSSPPSDLHNAGRAGFVATHALNPPTRSCASLRPSFCSRLTPIADR